MTDFTPTTEQVRDAYVRAMRNAFIASAGEHREEFDRWLTGQRAYFEKNGYAERLADEAAGIEADMDEWTSPAHVTLAAIRASLTEYEATCDWRELVRALRNILDGGDGHEWVDGATAVTRPNSKEDD